MTATPFLHKPGLVCALGSGIEAVSAALFSPHHSPLTTTDIYSTGLPLPLGAVNGPLAEVSSRLPRDSSRNNRLLLTALDQIQDQVDHLKSRYPVHRIGVVLGTSTSGIAEAEAAFAEEHRDGRFPGNYDYGVQEIGAPARFLARHLQLAGPAITISTACSSSAKALASAQRLLQTGFCDAILCGGADSLCKLTVNGFRALDSVSERVCNPMSRNRNGINIGEAACLFIMSREPSGVALSGYGESSDAHHFSAPHPEGNGAKSAMRRALQSASLREEQIDYINLHGTATPQNDRMEALAVDDVFGLNTPCSSTKPLTGHTLGAAGAVEAALCWIALQQQQMPPHRWDGAADPDLQSIQLVTDATDCARPLRHVLSNSFAFGGNNIALILSTTGNPGRRQ